MKTSIMHMGRHAVITLKEPVNHQNCNELEAFVLDATKKSHLSVILECKDVTYLDSAALEMLLRLQDTAKERGTMVKLAGLNELCRDIITVTRLINQFQVYSSVQEAIKESS